MIDWSKLGGLLRGQGPGLFERGGTFGGNVLREFVPGADGHTQIATFITDIQNAAIAHDAASVRAAAAALMTATQTTAPTIAVLASEIERAVSEATPDFVAIANISGMISAQNNPVVLQGSATAGLGAVRDHLEGLSPQFREHAGFGRVGRGCSSY